MARTAERVGNLRANVRTFCAIPQVLAFLKDYIVFAEKARELNKNILRQHQTRAVEATVRRALDPQLHLMPRLAHTQGSDPDSVCRDEGRDSFDAEQVME